MNNYFVKFSVEVNGTAVTCKGLAKTHKSDPVEVADEYIQSIYDDAIIEYPGTYYVTKEAELPISIDSINKVSNEEAEVLKKYL